MNEVNRIDKINYYLDIAETVSERSTCLKRQYGAIIVNNDEIISTGFNGAPRKIEDCLSRKYCLREKCERGTDYCNCLSVHAEMNAIISAARKDLLNSTLYLVGKERDKYVENPDCCKLCKRLIKNAGIKYVVIRIDKTDNHTAITTIDTDYWDTAEDFVGNY